MTEQIVNFALLGAEWVMYLLVALSVLSVAVMVERGMFFKRRSTRQDALLELATRAIRDDDTATFDKGFGDSEAMAVEVARAGIAQRKSGVDAASEAMNAAKLRSQDDYEQRLVVLGTLGNNAPFIGLFGTVLGIIQAFADLQKDPTGGINAVMGSTSEALAATAVGILVAIPAVVAFNTFNRITRSHQAGADAVAHAILGAMHAGAAASPAESKAKKEDSKAKNKGKASDDAGKKADKKDND